MRKLIRKLLPVGLVMVSILIVILLVSVNPGKRPERRDDASTALRKAPGDNETAT